MTFLDPAAEGVSEAEAAGSALEERKQPQTYQVESTAIRQLAYDPNDSTLTLQFTDGSIYQIDGFPEIELHRWLNSGSIGGYWNANVRGRY